MEHKHRYIQRWGAIWNAMQGRRPVAFCRLPEEDQADFALPETSVLVCPLVGKGRVIGAMVLADRESRTQLHSNDIKVMMAIA